MIMICKISAFHWFHKIFCSDHCPDPRHLRDLRDEISVLIHVLIRPIRVICVPLVLIVRI